MLQPTILQCGRIPEQSIVTQPRTAARRQRVTTIQCHKHLILINNQQLSPTSNTTRFIKYDQVEK